MKPTPKSLLRTTHICPWWQRGWERSPLLSPSRLGCWWQETEMLLLEVLVLDIDFCLSLRTRANCCREGSKGATYSFAYRRDQIVLSQGQVFIEGEWSQQKGRGCFCRRDVESSSSPRRHWNSIPSCSVRGRANPAAWLPPQGAQDERPGRSCAGWRFLGPPFLHREQQRRLILIWTLLQLWWLPFLSLHFLQKEMADGLELYQCFPYFGFFHFSLQIYTKTQCVFIFVRVRMDSHMLHEDLSGKDGSNPWQSTLKIIWVRVTYHPWFG